jgi:hypothetical protein
MGFIATEIADNSHGYLRACAPVTHRMRRMSARGIDAANVAKTAVSMGIGTASLFSATM